MRAFPIIKCVKQTNAGPLVETNEGVARAHPVGKHFICERCVDQSGKVS